MEYFWSEGGNNKPFFIYRYKVKKCTDEMYAWAEKYPSKGPFSRFHVEWDTEFRLDKPHLHKGYDIIQFELKDAYLAFQYAFAGEVLEDITWKEYQ